MNRMRNLLATLGVAGALSLTAAAQSATATLYDCAGIAADADRLACYDLAVAELRSAETSGEVVTLTSEEIEEARTDSFGRKTDGVEETLAARAGETAAAEPDEVTAGIASLGETRDGRLLVTLDNGQVWRQVDSTRVFVSRKAPPQSATVMKAALGSYRLKLGNARAFRAERVE